MLMLMLMRLLLEVTCHGGHRAHCITSGRAPYVSLSSPSCLWHSFSSVCLKMDTYARACRQWRLPGHSLKQYLMKPTQFFEITTIKPPGTSHLDIFRRKRVCRPALSQDFKAMYGGGRSRGLFDSWPFVSSTSALKESCSTCSCIARLAGVCTLGFSLME